MNYDYDYLVHYGVQGMKWGIRRYQNKDGSLTDAGKKRLTDESGTYMNASKKDRHTKNRKRVADEYTQEFNKLMKKHGIDPETMDGSEMNRRLAKNGEPYAADELWNSFVDKYSDATLKDLKIKNSAEAKKYVKNLFKDDLVDVDTLKREYADYKQRATDSINAKFSKMYEDAVKSGKSDLDIELIELEWMDELDNL